MLLPAPLWVMLLINASTLVVVVGYLVLPGFVTGLHCTWPLAVVLALCGVALTVLANPVRQRFAAAVAGLNRAQRAQAVAALRRDFVPCEPEVLAAALRLGTLMVAYRSRRWQRDSLTDRQQTVLLCVGVGVLMAIAISLTAADRFSDWKLVVVNTGVSLIFLWSWRQSRTARQIPQRLAVLREAVQSAEPAAVAELDPDSLPRQRRVLTGLIGGVPAAAAILLSGSQQGALSVPAQRSDCGIVRAEVNFLHEHSLIFDARLIGTGDYTLELAKYQQWSDQLHEYARQVSASEIAPHLRRIADLSTDAMATVRAAKQGGSPASLSDVYQHTMDGIVTEESAAAAVCHDDEQLVDEQRVPGSQAAGSGPSTTSRLTGCPTRAPTPAPAHRRAPGDLAADADATGASGEPSA